MLYKVASISLAMLCSPLLPSHYKRTDVENRPAPMAGRSKDMLSGLPSRWSSQRRNIAMHCGSRMGSLGPWFGMVC
jgi:hypothetical protein